MLYLLPVACANGAQTTTDEPIIGVEADEARALDCTGGRWCRCKVSTPCYPGTVLTYADGDTLTVPAGHLVDDELRDLVARCVAPVVDAHGTPVALPPGINVGRPLRDFMAGRVPVACGHYIAASEARVGLDHCERCPAPAGGTR